MCGLPSLYASTYLGTYVCMFVFFCIPSGRVWNRPGFCWAVFDDFMGCAFSSLVLTPFLVICIVCTVLCPHLSRCWSFSLVSLRPVVSPVLRFFRPCLSRPCGPFPCPLFLFLDCFWLCPIFDMSVSLVSDNCLGFQSLWVWCCLFRCPCMSGHLVLTSWVASRGFCTLS